MIDHITLPVSDYAQTKTKYDSILSSIGVTCLHEGEGYAGYGIVRPEFWIAEPFEGRESSRNAHVAIAVSSNELVNKFHETAIAQGWEDNGAPGPRPDYGESYYGAFVLDQDGNNIEAMCRVK